MKLNHRSTALLIVHLSIVTSILACGLPDDSSNLDAGATLDAAVQQTVSAQQTAGATVRPSPTPQPPTPTEQPPISVTLQYPTDTPGPATATTAPIQNTATSTVPPPSLATRPNGTPVHAFHINNPPTIDCNVSDLVPLNNVIDQPTFGAENWSGVSDNKADYSLAWDSNNLYLATHVTDDVHAQIALGELLFRGDSLELLLDANLQGDYNSDELSADDFQMGFTPGENKVGGPDSYLWFPRDKSGRPNGVTVMGCQDETGNGFYLETSVPWSTFGVSPIAGSTFGFTLSVSDNDVKGTEQQQSMISSVSARRLTNPTTWGTLILDP
jgi:hypothetical protein